MMAISLRSWRMMEEEEAVQYTDIRSWGAAKLALSAIQLAMTRRLFPIL